MRNTKIINSDPNGSHALIELKGCDFETINNCDLLKNLFICAIKENNIELLESSFYEFNPNGFTGIFLLSSSHISIHTWPEFGYCVIDVFTCSGKNVTCKIYKKLVDNIQHKFSKIYVLERGYEHTKTTKEVLDVRKLLLFSTGKKMKITVTDEVAQINNKYHKIEILDTIEFGKCLLINNIMQLSEFDHSLYDNALLSKLPKHSKSILIIGGGDGFVANTAIKLNNKIKNIQIVDIDKDVIDLCNRIFHVDNNFKKILKYTIDNILIYLEKANIFDFDYIICDLTDDPIQIDSDTFEDFYNELFEQLSKKAKKGTWVAIQASTSKVSSGVDFFKIIKKSAKKYFTVIQTDIIHIPSFGEDGAFVFGKV